MTLPRDLRNRLAELILAGFHDATARRRLDAIAGMRIDSAAVAADDTQCAPCRPATLASGAASWPFDESRGRHGAELAARAERARRALVARPLDPPDPPLVVVLEEAGILFDARLYFEVHEILEPRWLRAGGDDREALQGLIQAAVALHHLAAGNTVGARSVLRDAIGKLRGRRLAGLCLDRFGEALRACLDGIPSTGDGTGASFDWAIVPRFPRAAA